MQIADGNTSNYFLSTFGRAKRETVCSCEVKVDPNLSQALHLINGKSVHEKIINGKLVRNMRTNGSSLDEVVDEIYQRCLARRPTEVERKAILAEWQTTKQEFLDGNKSEKPKVGQLAITFLEDIFWAVLNSREFIFNH